MPEEFDIKPILASIEKAAQGAFTQCDMIDLRELEPILEKLSRNQIAAVASVLPGENSKDDIAKPSYEVVRAGDDKHLAAIVFHGGFMSGCDKEHDYTYVPKPWQRQF